MSYENRTDRQVSASEALEAALLEIERAWYDFGDRSIVQRLIAEHPRLEAELCEFAEALFAASEDVISPYADAEDHVYEWLQTHGIEKALKAAAADRKKSTDSSTPAATEGASKLARGTKSAPRHPWLVFLHHRTGTEKKAIAAQLPNVTFEFLLNVSRYPELVPDQVKSTLASLVEQYFGVPARDSLSCLSQQPGPLKRAASRSRPANHDPTTFEDLVDRSALRSDARAYWLTRGKAAR